MVVAVVDSTAVAVVTVAAGTGKVFRPIKIKRLQVSSLQPLLSCT
jgi:hypothetical protein